VVEVEEPEREQGKVVDLMEVLKKSLAGKRKAA
jgi:non-homologous end joining protein Ku